MNASWWKHCEINCARSTKRESLFNTYTIEGLNDLCLKVELSLDATCKPEKKNGGESSKKDVSAKPLKKGEAKHSKQSGKSGKPDKRVNTDNLCCGAVRAHKENFR